MYLIRDTFQGSSMATASSMLHVRIDDDVKAKAAEALAAMGLTTSDAVRLLFHRIVADQAFPLELKVPNQVTRDAMAEADAIISGKKARFDDGNSLIAALDG
jgi:DNA-damage-inducible protein J